MEKTEITEMRNKIFDERSFFMVENATFTIIIIVF